MQKLFDLLQRRIWLGPLFLALTLFVGMGLGLLIGWVIAPVSWTPNADDLRAISDSYALNNDLKLAQTRLANVSTADQVRLFNRIIAESAVRNRPIEAEHATSLSQALRLNPASSSSTPLTSIVPSTNPSSSFPISTLLIICGAMLVLALLFAGIFLLVRMGLPRMRAARSRPASEMEAGTDLGSEETPHPSQPPRSAAAPAGVAAASLGRVQAAYTAGMDNFDASFPLETARQGFLGECGIGVSETVGDGLPDKVTAFDLWLFDKTDVRTVTQLVMSEYAFNDPGVRAKLQTKGDAVLATKDQIVTLETQSLKLEARVQDLAYASNPSLPPNSYFLKLVIEIVTFVK